MLTFAWQGATMARMRYVVTGGTGFIGRRVVSQILARSEDAEVWVLVRRESLARFERLASHALACFGNPVCVCRLTPQQACHACSQVLPTSFSHGDP